MSLRQSHSPLNASLGPFFSSEVMTLLSIIYPQVVCICSVFLRASQFLLDVPTLNVACLLRTPFTMDSEFGVALDKTFYTKLSLIETAARGHE